MSPAQNSLRRNYEWDSYSNRREQEQYNEYLDERDNGNCLTRFIWDGREISLPSWAPVPVVGLSSMQLDRRRLGLGTKWRLDAARERLKQERQMEAQRRGASEGTAGWAASRPRQPDPELGLSKADRVLGRRRDNMRTASPHRDLRLEALRGLKATKRTSTTLAMMRQVTAEPGCYLQR